MSARFGLPRRLSPPVEGEDDLGEGCRVDRDVAVDVADAREQGDVDRGADRDVATSHLALRDREPRFAHSSRAIRAVVNDGIEHHTVARRVARTVDRGVGARWCVVWIPAATVTGRERERGQRMSSLWPLPDDAITKFRVLVFVIRTLARGHHSPGSMHSGDHSLEQQSNPEVVDVTSWLISREP